MNRTAADIARAYARFASQATGELLQLGAEATGAASVCLYWRLRDQIISVPDEPERSPGLLPLRQRMRSEYWPWVQRQALASGERVLRVSTAVSVAADATSPGTDDCVVLLTLHDHPGELGGIIALQVTPAQCDEIIGPWHVEAIGFAELVRQNLLADLDPDSGLLTPASFDAELQRWRDSAGERQARACLLTVYLDHLPLIEQTFDAQAHRTAFQEVLALIETRLRSRDLVARLGPASVGVMLKQCDLIDARRVCEALEDRLRGYQFRWGIRRFAGRLRFSMRLLDAGSQAISTADRPVAAEDHPDRLLADDSALVTTVVDAALDVLDCAWRSHKASVLAFPARGQPVLPADPDASAGLPAALTLRALPCRLLVNTDRVVLYRLRSMLSGGTAVATGGQADGATHRPGTLSSSAGDATAARQQLLTMLDQIATGLALADPQSAQPPTDANPALPGRSPASLQADTGAGITAGLLLGIEATLIDDSLVDWLAEACQARAIPLSRLCLSVAEAAVVANVRRLLPALRRLHRRGFRLCAESGSGGIESSALLRRLPLDYLYVPIHPGRAGGSAAVILQRLVEQVALADAQGARVICGGVDTADQVSYLASLGVQLGHGRALGASIPVSRLATSSR